MDRARLGAAGKEALQILDEAQGIDADVETEAYEKFVARLERFYMYATWNNDARGDPFVPGEFARAFTLGFRLGVLLDSPSNAGSSPDLASDMAVLDG